MARYDFTTQRLYVPQALATGALVPLSAGQAHYLVNVLRAKAGAQVLLFNGMDGEWLAVVEKAGKRAVDVRVGACTRPQDAPCDLHFVFAPIKRARLDYVAQKAVELGASVLQPVLTAHTQSERINLDRLKANAIEAAEQCGVLNLADVRVPAKLGPLLEGWDRARQLIYCDEHAPVSDPLLALGGLRPGPLAVLIGPEGGFSSAERESLKALDSVTALSLGPRIMRADTAGVAVLALVQAALGDWR